MTTEKALRRKHIEALRKQWGDKLFPCDAEFYALCDMALASLSLPETQGKPVAWILKTGHGTKLVEVKPPCEVDFWRPLVYGDTPPPSQPAQGWKLVPVEPTREMIAEGLSAWCDLWGSAHTRYSGIYKAMLAAAPAAPTQAKPTNGEGA